MDGSNNLVRLSVSFTCLWPLSLTWFWVKWSACQGEIFSNIKWRPPLSLWWNLFFGVPSNAVVLFLIDLKLSVGYMIEFDYWICALIHVLWLYILFISFRKLSVISSNCNRMLNRKHGMEITAPKGYEEFQWFSKSQNWTLVWCA